MILVNDDKMTNYNSEMTFLKKITTIRIIKIDHHDAKSTF